MSVVAKGNDARTLVLKEKINAMIVQFPAKAKLLEDLLVELAI